jgi:hypothetical protein
MSDPLAEFTPEQKEVAQAVLSLLASRAEKGATEAEMDAVGDWVESIQTQRAMLDLVLHGAVEIVGVQDGEPVFRATAQGKAAAETL